VQKEVVQATLADDFGLDVTFRPTGAAPSRPRTDHNPLDRKDYLLHVLRRVRVSP